MDPETTPPARKTSRRLPVTVGVVMALGAVAMVAYAIGPHAAEVQPDGREVLVLVHGGVRSLIALLGMGTAMALMFLGVYALATKRTAVAVVTLGFVLGVFPAVLVGFSPKHLTPWRRGIVMPDPGGDYVALVRENLTEVALGREIENGLLTRRYAVLGRLDLGGDLYFASVVRPARYTAVRGPGGTLMRAPDERILWLRGQNEVFLVFDPRAGRALQGEALLALDPFLLLTAETTPSPGDLQRIEARLQGVERIGREQLLQGVEDAGVPRREHLVDGLRSDVPAIQDAARRLLDASGRRR